MLNSKKQTSSDMPYILNYILVLLMWTIEERGQKGKVGEGKGLERKESYSTC
jgi:hypothetical protein